MRRAATGAVLLATLLLVAACDSSADTTTTTVLIGSTSTTSSTTTVPPETGDPLDVAKQAVVSVAWAQEENDGTILLTGPGGSGSVVSQDGLILTNAHVAQPDAPGQAVLYGPDDIAPPELLVIRFVEVEDRPPVARFLAEPLTVDGWLDLAVLRPVAFVETTADGTLVRGDPVQPGSIDLMPIPIGSSDEVTAGADMVVLGFPGIGGETLSVTGNLVSGFLDDAKLGPRGWIKTDAKIAPGNSGGMALVDGSLIGVPTRGPSEEEAGFNQLRPISFAAELIADAAAGESYVQATGVVAGTGEEQFVHDRWATTVDEQGDCAVDQVATFPSGLRRMYAQFDYTGFTDGEDVFYAWVKDGSTLMAANQFVWDFGPQGTCFWLSLGGQQGGALADGRYDLAVFAGPHLALVGGASTEVGVETAAAVRIIGEALDRDTGLPIVDALLVFLEPGVDVDAWLADPSEEGVVSYGSTGADGRIDLGNRFVPGTVYPVVGVADGYQDIVADFELAIDADAEWVVTFRFAPAGG